MPNTREKLIELLREVQYQGNAVHGYHDKYIQNSELADHLIANGVTLAKDINVPIKWIPVTERLPEQDGKYLVFRKCAYGTDIDTLRFAKDGRKVDKYDFHRGWKNVWHRYDSEYGHLTIDNVTHWMPLPEPPKGE
jgi:hypothetical protein